MKGIKRARTASLVIATSVALVAAISSTLVSWAADPGDEPFPTIEVLDEAQSIVAHVVFHSSTDVEFVGAEVSPAPPPARIGGPPLVQIEALDNAGAVLETYNDWHPLWTGERGGVDGEDDHSLVVEETGEGRFIVEFAPSIETVKVTDIRAGQELIEFDVQRTVVAYCVGNPDDPGCETVCIGDVDRDGEVTSDDILIVAMAQYSSPSEARWHPNADVNQDGLIDPQDLLLVVNTFGEGGC